MADEDPRGKNQPQLPPLMVPAWVGSLGEEERSRL